MRESIAGIITALILLTAVPVIAGYATPAYAPSLPAWEIPNAALIEAESQAMVLVYDEQGVLDFIACQTRDSPLVLVLEPIMCAGSPGRSAEDADIGTHLTLIDTIRFQAREFDAETGLYYFRHRYYDPELGRFTQTDPMGYQDSMNLYQAFGQSPQNFGDPMGLDVFSDWDFFPSKEEIKKAVSNAPAGPLNQVAAGFTKAGLKSTVTGVPPVGVIYGAYKTIKAGREAYKTGGYQAAKKVTLQNLKETGIGIVPIWGAVHSLNQASEAYFYYEDYEAAGEYLFSGATGTVYSATFGVGGARLVEAWRASHAAMNEELAIYQKWPEQKGMQGGFLGDFKVIDTTKPGQVFSRIGGLQGRYVSPPGTSLGARGLPSSYPNITETIWEVVKPFKMEAGIAAPWKDAPGMGVQYRLEMTIQELWEAGFIKLRS